MSVYGSEPTSDRVRYSVAVEGKTDMTQTSSRGPNLTRQDSHRRHARIVLDSPLVPMGHERTALPSPDRVQAELEQDARDCAATREFNKDPAAWVRKNLHLLKP